MREQRLKEKELEKIRYFEKKEKQLESNFSSGLEKFDVDKTKEH